MDKKVEVINKFGQTLAIFTSEDEETVDRMIDPVVTLTQNSDNVFSFSISEKSQKWEDIKSVENLYVVDGHVYSPLFEDSYNVVKSEDGQNLIQVRAYERQKMLEKVYVTAWNSETGFADIDAFMVVILSKGNLPLKNGNKATGVEAIVDPGEYSLGSAGYIMAGLLYGTGWNVGIVDVEGYFDFETEQLSVYENLLKVQELYGGILIFDSMNKIVHLRQESNYISYTGYEVRYKKNLKDMDLAIDNKIVTRLYVFGEAGLNIASVNDEKIYLENYTYSNEVFEDIESNTDIYEPDQLKAWGERKLLDLCAPRKVLTTNIAYLTQKEGFEQEKLKLNDSVRVYYGEAEFVAPEAGVEIVSTEIEAESVKAKKESYITLKGNTSQETVEGEDGEEVIDTDIAIINADIEKENYIELQGNTSQATSILPDEYQQVEYITSNAKQYIKTGFAANQDTSIEMKVTTTTLNANAAFYCSRKGLNSNTFCSFRINGQLRHDYGNTQTDTSYTLKVNTPYKIYSNKNKLYVNDSLVHTATYTNFQSPYNMLLLASQDNSQDAGANYWSGNLYYCKIWDNETLVRDFVPCYRKSDNTIGLYDRVEGIFYTNAGTGSFTKGADSVIPNPDYPQDIHVVKGENVIKISSGPIIPDEYQQVEYIESDGNQYIDTDYIPNYETKIYCKFAHNEHVLDTPVFGARTSNSGNQYVLWSHPEGYTATGKSQTNFNGKIQTLENYPEETMVEFEYSKTGGKYGLIEWTWSTTSGTPNVTLAMFTLKQGTNIDKRKFSGKMWAFKIWDKEILVRDFIPCYRKSDNAIGMYDIVNGTFYANLGTGNFTKGPNVVTEYKIDLNSSLISMNPSAWEQGSISAQNGSNMDNNTRLRTKDYYPITAGTYYLKIQDNNYVWTNIEYYNESKNFLYAQGDVKSITGLQESAITITSQNVKYLRAVIKHSDNTSVVLPEYIETIKPTIQEGNSYIDPIELCETEDYKDKIHKNLANGKWYVHKEIGKYQITGQESSSVFYWVNEVRGMRLILDDAIKTTANAPLYCNRFKLVQSASTDANYVRLNRTTGVNYTGVWFGNISITGVSNATTFKTYASSNDIILYYPLATPTEIEITSPTLIAQLEALYTAELAGSTTYISTVADDLEPFIDLKYNVVTQMPSPQKPSEVQVVTGENKFEIVGKQLYNYKDTSSVTTGFVTDDEGWISYTYDNSTGTTTRFANYWTHDLDLKPSQKYALFVEVKNVSGNAYFSFNSTQGTNGQVTGGGGRSFTEMTNNSIYRAEITARESHTGNMGLRSFITYGAGKAGSITFRMSVIEDLTISKENFKYEPYQKTSYTVNFGDLELCNINNYQDYTFKNSIENPHYNPNLEINAWYKYSEIGKVVLDGVKNISGISTHSGKYVTFNYNNSDILKTSSYIITNVSDKLIGATGRDTWNGLKMYSVSQQSNGNYIQVCVPTEIGTTYAELQVWLKDNPITVWYVKSTPTNEKITDLALTTQLEALYKATLVSPYSHIYSDSGFPIIDLRYNVITPSLYIDSNSDLLRVTGVDYPVFNPSSATLTLGDVTLNTNDIFKKISNTTNAYTGGLIPAGSVKTTTYDGISKPITQEFETQHALNSTFQYGIGSLNLSVSEVSKLVDENGDDIRTLEEHIGEVEVTTEGLKTTVTNRSGNNLLRNSSALFREEFWRGEVVQSTATEVQQNFFAKSCFYLQDGTLGQRIAVPNGDYYVGFKYKKLVELANCVVSVNGSPITLDKMEYTTVDKYITVNDNNIDIEIKSDTDNSFYLGDIMVVAGNKEKWSPNPNEIFYNTVEIGKGIQVTSNDRNSYTRIDADGNRIYNKASDEVVTELTDEGMITNKVYCEQLTAAGVLHQKVLDKYNEEQAWLTKI